MSNVTIWFLIDVVVLSLNLVMVFLLKTLYYRSHLSGGERGLFALVEVIYSLIIFFTFVAIQSNFTFKNKEDRKTKIFVISNLFLVFLSVIHALKNGIEWIYFFVFYTVLSAFIYSYLLEKIFRR